MKEFYIRVFKYSNDLNNRLLVWYGNHLNTEHLNTRHGLLFESWLENQTFSNPKKTHSATILLSTILVPDRYLGDYPVLKPIGLVSFPGPGVLIRTSQLVHPATITTSSQLRLFPEIRTKAMT